MGTQERAAVGLVPGTQLSLLPLRLKSLSILRDQGREMSRELSFVSQVLAEVTHEGSGWEASEDRP